MQDDQSINRNDYIILRTLYNAGCKDFFISMSLSEIMDENEPTDNGEKCALGRRLTVYRRLKRLVEKNYVKIGVLDNHAYTYYITECGSAILEH